MKILLELRPALDGHAGIPQETRLLFRGLMQLAGTEVEGLLQSGNLVLSKGLPSQPEQARGWPGDRRINRLSRVAVSLQPGRGPTHLELLRAAVRLASTLFGGRQALTRFDPRHFEDLVWRTLFAKTLPSEDFAAVTAAGFRVLQVPWGAMHYSAVATSRLGHAVFPRLDTRGFDVMVAETPYPGRVSAPTRLVVRYHDAFPLLMPHTIIDRAHHQASHYQALRRNVRDGAWFACVSDASRRDLISIFPEAEPRTVTIPNMASHSYFAEDRGPDRIADILRTRANSEITAQVIRNARPPEASPAPAATTAPSSPSPTAAPEYLLMVSTLEPRKNHLALLAAWEQLRATGFPRLQLVLVGMLGWGHEAIVTKLLPWVARDVVHVLDDVPAGELRQLYRHAAVTVCPSLGEGFGFSGVEAMLCGSVVAASDLPVHREVYADAAEYFNPYAVDDIARTLGRLMGAAAEPRRAELVARGGARAKQYQPETVLPRWHEFLGTLSTSA